MAYHSFKILFCPATATASDMLEAIDYLNPTVVRRLLPINGEDGKTLSDLFGSGMADVCLSGNISEDDVKSLFEEPRRKKLWENISKSRSDDLCARNYGFIDLSRLMKEGLQDVTPISKIPGNIKRKAYIWRSLLKNPHEQSSGIVLSLIVSFKS